MDSRFKNAGQDARFPSPGTDVRFPGGGVDARFLDGADTRFESETYGTAPGGGVSAVTFGALDLASFSGLDAPAGATSITDADSTNLVLSEGKVKPDTGGGVTSGTVTFDNGATWDVTAAAATYCVNDDDEAHAAALDANPAGGVTIRFHPGVKTLGTQRIGGGTSFASPIVVTGDPTTVLQPGIQFGAVNGLVIEGLEIYDPVGDLLNNLITVHGPATNVVVQDCFLHGVDLDPFGDYSASGAFQNVGAAFSNKNSGGLMSGFTFRRNRVQDCQIGVKPNLVGSAAMSITDNMFSKIYTDASGVIVGDTAFLTAPKEFSRNFFFMPMGRASDADNPHSDFFQVNFSAAADGQDLENLKLEQNIMLETPSLSRGDFLQGLVSFATTVISDPVVRGNIIICKSGHGITFTNIKGGIFEGNTVASFDPSEPGNSPKITLGDEGSWGEIQMLRNVAESFNLGAVGVGRFTVTDDVSLGLGGATVPYTTAFDGPAFAPENLAETLARYSPNAGGPLEANSVGAIGTGMATFGDLMDPAGWTITASPPEETNAPILQSRALATDGVTLTLAYNETLAGTIATGDVAVTVDGTAATVSAAEISGVNVVLTLASQAPSSVPVTVAYSGTGVTDRKGNAAPTFTALSVVNNSTGGASGGINIVDTQGTASLTIPAAQLTASTDMTISLMAASDTSDVGEFYGSNRISMKKVGVSGFAILFKRDGENIEQYNATWNTGTLSEDPANPSHVHIQASFGATSGDEGDSFVNVYIDGVLTPPDSGGLNTGQAYGAIFSDLDTGIGGGQAGTTLTNAYIGNFYLETGAARPIGSFYSGGPLDLTGVGAPQVLVNGDAAAWNAGSNSGSGSTLTVISGTFTDVT